jgi:hypothetical protein
MVIDEFFERTTEPENRIGFVYSPIELKIALNRNYKTGSTSITSTDEQLLDYHIAFHSIPEFKRTVHLKATQLLESGIFWFLYEKGHYPRDFTSNPEPIGPQVLSMTHLKAGFIIFCVFLSLSIVAFIFECGPTVSKKVFHMCLSVYIVVKFTKMNKMF